MQFKGLKWGILTLLLTCVASLSFGQSARSLRINEVLLNNQSGLIDENGNHVAWLEIYNTSAATINLGGLFLTDDLSQPMKYPIRRGNNITKLSPHHSFVIFIDGKDALGTKHSGLHLDPSVENTLYLVDSDGRLLIDQVTIPVLGADKSYARKGENHDFVESIPTPGEDNEYTHGRESLALFKANDPTGAVMTLIAMPVVFVALVILFFVFHFFGKYHTNEVKKKASMVTGKTIEEVGATIDMPAEVYAAIGMALYEFQNTVHDEEDTVITINPPQRRYSPWSSKIYTLRQEPTSRR